MARDWEDYVRGEELKALGEVAIANLRAILEAHGCEDVAHLDGNAYKYTNCGASVGVKLDTGETVYGSDLVKLDAGAPIVALLVTSIVEGVEQGTETVTVDLLDEEFETPEMAVAAYDSALENVEQQADAIWRETHGCPTCAKHFGGVASNGIEFCEGDDGMTPIWDECPDCGGGGSVI